jgi:hypothetical protein
MALAIKRRPIVDVVLIYSRFDEVATTRDRFVHLTSVELEHSTHWEMD